MTVPRLLLCAGAMVLVAVSAPVGASARPPQAPLPLASLTSPFVPPPSIAGPHVVVSRVGAPPAHARPGGAYVLRGTVVNEGSAATRGRIVLRLLRVGTPPLVVGRTSLALPAHDSAGYGVRIRIPR